MKVLLIELPNEKILNVKRGLRAKNKSEVLKVNKKCDVNALKTPIEQDKKEERERERDRKVSVWMNVVGLAG